jgi:hypothetical protein
MTEGLVLEVRLMRIMIAEDAPMIGATTARSE